MFGLTPYRRNSGLRRRDPFRDMGDFIDSFFNDSIMSPFISGVNYLRNELNPIRADVRETENEYIIDMEIPGVRKEDISLDIKDDILDVRVEQNEMLNEERENFIRRERRYGSYRRSFHIPDVKHEDIKAKYLDGILTISLPKADDVKKKSRKIDIQ